MPGVAEGLLARPEPHALAWPSDRPSTSALQRRRDRAIPHQECLSQLELIRRAIPHAAALWAGKGGRRRLQLLDVLMARAQARDSLEVEETLERLADLIGVASLGTVWLRLSELEAAGWLVHVSTGRKHREGTVKRLQIPPHLRRLPDPRDPQLPLISQAELAAQIPLRPNRDILKGLFSPRLCLGGNELKPRQAQLQTTQKAQKPAPNEPGQPPGPPQHPAPRDTHRAEQGQTTAQQGNPRRIGRSSGRQPAPRGGQVWSEEAYMGMLEARIVATGQAWAALTARERGQVRAETRLLLAGGFEPGDVEEAQARFGARRPMALVGLLRAIRRAEDPSTPRPEQVGARLPVTWPPDPLRQAELEALAEDARPAYGSVGRHAQQVMGGGRPDRFGELLSRWSARAPEVVEEDSGEQLLVDLGGPDAPGPAAAEGDDVPERSWPPDLTRAELDAELARVAAWAARS